MLSDLRKELKSLANPSKAKVLSGFFKCGPGEYGEGDVFFGITVPQSRILSKKYPSLSLSDIENLLQSKVHEERLIALMILATQYQKAKKENNGKLCKEIVEFYLGHTDRVNNWDLVDSSAHLILGDHLLDKDRGILYDLAKSKSLWERRIAIVATLQFIRSNRFDETFAISELLLKDAHDLIHKASGWMLREVGKRDEKTLKRFLDKHYKIMPRTMLRYSIERLSPKERDHYMGR